VIGRAHVRPGDAADVMLLLTAEAFDYPGPPLLRRPRRFAGQ